MQKLFLAIGFPPGVTERLAQLQPQAGPGIRIVDRGQMHLTLHYLGAAEPVRVKSVLTDVRAAAFELSLAGVGQFATAGNSSTLWAGAKSCHGLLSLRDALSTALRVHGWQPEARAYHPHVTLARCESLACAPISREFVLRHADFCLPPTLIDRFALYASVGGDMPHYTMFQSFALGPQME